MSAERLAINDFVSLSIHQLIIDVRSPSEYNQAHLPGAINIPLFDDEERKIVGTAYKQKSREEAIKIGLGFFGPKMKKTVEEVERIYEVQFKKTDLPQNQIASANNQRSMVNSVFVYCWRGGMRSAAVAWLLDLYGFKVAVLVGGYKRFRNWVLEKLTYPYSFKIIGGFTGSGKTRILKELEEKGELAIDLEALARHKGSAFGNIGMPAQPSQEMFENVLALDLVNKYETGKKRTESKVIAEGLTWHPQKTIWLEDESQRIGSVNIPPSLWKEMRQSPVYFLEIPFEERLQYIIEEYGSYDKEQMTEAIKRIGKRLGPLETKKAIEVLQQDNVVDCFRILLKYYDKHYLKGLHNRHNLPALLTSISCSTVQTANATRLLSQPAIL